MEVPVCCRMLARRAWRCPRNGTDGGHAVRNRQQGCAGRGEAARGGAEMGRVWSLDVAGTEQLREWMRGA